uniref:Uncharacterized protein n=1 Tax=Panagrellus redivivus TaxID=6233 RepID=A0A7E4W2M5_PANRE
MSTTEETPTLPPRLADDILMLEMTTSIRNITERMDITMATLEYSAANLTESLVKVVDNLAKVVGFVPPGWLYYIMMVLIVMTLMGVTMIVITSVIIRILEIRQLVRSQKSKESTAEKETKPQEKQKRKKNSDILLQESQPKTNEKENTIDQKDN